MERRRATCRRIERDPIAHPEKRRHRGWWVAILAVLVWVGAIAPSDAHWSDMAAAEVLVGQQDVQITLTIPTGLVAFADDNGDGALSMAEVQAKRAELQTFLAQQIYLDDRQGQRATLTVSPVDSMARPARLTVAPTSHSTLRLNYTWPRAIAGFALQDGFTLRYGLFLPGVETAHCLATILQNGHLQTVLLTPKRMVWTATPGWIGQGMGQTHWLWAIAAAFGWGALHSLTPGHGKTLVGAYLIGERATANHALFLALTTTITHTLGVFALGLVALFATQYILPQQLYPWLSLLSGLMVVAIGVQLLRHRFGHHLSHSPHPGHHHGVHHHGAHHHGAHHHGAHHHHGSDHHSGHPHHDSDRHHGHPHALDHHHDHPHHPEHHLKHHLKHHPEHHHHGYHDHHDHHDHDDHDHYDHNHHPQHHHGHSHQSHHHSHDSALPVTWRSLLLLGIAGGILPCPAALVLLLGAIALNQVALGLALVVAFSLGLAGVLTAIGLVLVYAKSLARWIPAETRVAHQRWTRWLPIASALCITLIGLGVSLQAAQQMVGASSL
jgi:nickel/cobalt transporter (NicO) family protein